jgi:fused signal recognition particle receptor
MSDKPAKRGGFFGVFRRAAAPAPMEPAAAAPVVEEQIVTALAADVAEVASLQDAPAEPPAKQGWFQRLKAGLTKTSASLTQDIAGIFTKRKLDADTLQELEDLLIQADLGVETAMRITDVLAKDRHSKEISPEEVRAVLAAEVERVLDPVAKPLVIDDDHKPHVILVVGVNGTGKTTTIGKIAHRLAQDGRTVMLAAGDTFRAAAIDQLKIWGERTGAEVIARNVGADSAGLAFDALARAREQECDVLLIDTAGRLQNKQALMGELEKVVRVLRKVDPSAPHQVLLVLDATTGQNALNQVEVFKDKAGVTGLIMTKLDGTARGGILVAISAKFGLPVHAIGVGEGVEDLDQFDAGEFARAIAVG